MTNWPMPTEDVNNLDDVVHELGIEDSFTTPAEAVRKLKAEIERLQGANADMLEMLKTIENDDGQVPQRLWLQIKAVIARAEGRDA